MTGLGEAARQVAEIAAEGAATADATGRLAPEVIDAVRKAGFARHFVPAKWGGGSGSFGELSPAVAEVGTECSATAWFASLTATAGRMAGYLPLEGQRQVWVDGPDTVVVACLLRHGDARRVAGGWRVGGTWPYVSSAELCGWALVLAGTDAPGGRGGRFAAVPRSALEVRPAWSALGMRATASHDVEIADVFVPDELTFDPADLHEGTPGASEAPFHRVPLKAVTGLTFLPPMLGAARGVLRAWSEPVLGRLAAGTAAGMETATTQLVLARSVAEIGAAEALVDRVASAADGQGFTRTSTARSALDTAYAAELVLAATDRVVRHAGTAAIADDTPLQRGWRDVRTAASHGTLRFATKAAAYVDTLHPEH